MPDSPATRAAPPDRKGARRSSPSRRRRRAPAFEGRMRPQPPRSTEEGAAFRCLPVASRTVTRRSFALYRVASICEIPGVFFKSPVKRGPKKGFSQILPPRLCLRIVNIRYCFCFWICTARARGGLRTRFLQLRVQPGDDFGEL